MAGWSRKAHFASGRQREQERRELARGPIDLPFLMMVLMLVWIGLIMMFSASFA